MSTKLRSACDKCHETKVRCSGGLPCRGCLMSRSLCFYSVSSPLGRPKGTKKRPSRGQTTGNYARDNDLSPKEKHHASTTVDSAVDATARKRDYNHRSLLKRKDGTEGRDEPSVRSPVLQRQFHTAAEPLAMGGIESERDMHFDLTMPPQGDIHMPDITLPSNVRSLSQNTPISECQRVSDDLSMLLGFNSPNASEELGISQVHLGQAYDTGTRDHFSWGSEMYDTAHSVPDQAASAEVESLDSPETPKETPSSPSSVFDYVRRSASIQTSPLTNLEHMPVTSGSNQEWKPSKEPASSKTVSSTACTCLQRHAEILSNPILLELRADVDSEESLGSIDKALSLTQQATSAWDGLLACEYCSSNDDQEVILLAYMSIRAVTRYLQHLSPRYISPRKGRDIEKKKTSQRSNGEMRLQIGSFELEGDDLDWVLRCLYQKTLQKVKCMLQSLQQIQNEKKTRLLEVTQGKLAGIEDYQASNNLFLIQQMSNALIASIHTLEVSLTGQQ